MKPATTRISFENKCSVTEARHKTLQTVGFHVCEIRSQKAEEVLLLGERAAIGSECL